MSEQLVPITKPDDQPIEAGEVGEIQDLPFHEAKHRAETARSLATWLVVLLGASLGVHYLLVCILAFSGKNQCIRQRLHNSGTQMHRKSNTLHRQRERALHGGNEQIKQSLDHERIIIRKPFDRAPSLTIIAD